MADHGSSEGAGGIQRPKPGTNVDEDMMDRSDAVLLEVLTQEVERMASEVSSQANPLAMVAGLLRTIGREEVELPSVPDRKIDPAVLKSYLVSNGLADETSAVTMLRSTLGFSKDTYLITVASDGAAPTTLAIRRDIPAGTTRTTVLDEYALLRELHRQGFPVAPPVLIEPHPPPELGRPFMLSAAMPGDPGFPQRTTDPAAKVEAARQLADFLARLHTIPTETIPVRRLLETGADAKAELRAYIAEWRRLWEECCLDRHRDLIEGFEQLEAGVPDIERLSLVHADIGFHNILIEDNIVTAVLDWEFAHLGEPEEDLAYARPSIEALVSWDAFLQMYREAGGREPSQHRLAAYASWQGLRNATCCAVGRKAFDSGLSADLKLAYAGRVILESSVASARQHLET